MGMFVERKYKIVCDICHNSTSDGLTSWTWVKIKHLFSPDSGELYTSRGEHRKPEKEKCYICINCRMVIRDKVKEAR